MNVKRRPMHPRPAAGETTSGQRCPRPEPGGPQSWSPWRTRRWTCCCVCCPCWRTTGGSRRRSCPLLHEHPDQGYRTPLCSRPCQQASFCDAGAACPGGCRTHPSETPPLREGRGEEHRKFLHCCSVVGDGQRNPCWGGNHNGTGGSVWAW